MKLFNQIIPLAFIGLASVASPGVLAQTNMNSGKIGELKVEPSAATSEMTDGEVRKVDKNTRKITIKHGVIKNLDMPPMTMVFHAKDAAMLEKVQKGDKVKFIAVMEGSAMVVTAIQTVK